MADTYNNLYLDARRALYQAGVEQAQLEARELLCFAADKTRARFYRDMGLYVPDHVERRFDELLARRLAGEPVAYIIGEWEFFGLTLDVCREVLIPRPDTETLAERAVEFVKALPEGARVLDLCAGSGCIGLAIAANCPGSRVLLADWSEDALRVCRQNIRRCDLTRQVSTTRVNALEAPPSILRDFDLVVCNPPYIRTAELAELDVSVREYEPVMALDGGEDGLVFYRAVAEKWKNVLKTGGKLMFEIGWDQAPDVEDILAANGYTEIVSLRDPGAHWRVVEGRVE